MEKHIFLDEQEVSSYLIDDERCTKAMLEEVVDTLRLISNRKGRRWTFNTAWDGYVINEYNEHNDFVKLYKFRL